MNHYFKHTCGGYVTQPKGWQIRKHRWPGPFPGDFIFLNSLIAIITNDRQLILLCYGLLQEGVRWPIELDPPKSGRYRSRRSMTRDPFIMWIVAAWFILDEVTFKNLVAHLKVPWYLDKQYFRSWRDYMVTGSHRYEEDFSYELMSLIKWGAKTKRIHSLVSGSRYKLIRQIRHRVGLNGYSLHLWGFMIYTAGQSGNYLYAHVPLWNHLVRMLTNESCRSAWLADQIRDHQSHEPYPWSQQKMVRGDSLEGQELQLDKQMLKFIYYHSLREIHSYQMAMSHNQN